jgi:hypothetical protein
MKRQYDFSKAKRGAVVAGPKNKKKITIRLDRESSTGFAAKWNAGRRELSDFD